MIDSKQKRVIGFTAVFALIVAAFVYFWPTSTMPVPQKPPVLVMPVQMPPPPPVPTPEQLAEAQRKLDEANAAEVAAAELEAKEKAKAKATQLTATKAKAKPTATKKKVSVSKGVRTVTEVAAQPKTEPAKPREVRFNMSQDGKKMTAEDFDAWMKAQGIRIVPAKPVEPPKTEDKKDGG